MSFVVNENRLETANGVILLPFAIKKVLSVQDGFIVLVDDGRKHGYGDNSMDRNIYAYSENGDLKWQVQPCPFGDEKRPRPYTDIYHENKALIAYNWLGVYCKIDIKNGEVSLHNVTQRPW